MLPFFAPKKRFLSSESQHHFRFAEFGKVAPFSFVTFLNKKVRGGSNQSDCSSDLTPEDASQSLKIDPSAIDHQPIQNFIKKSWIIPAHFKSEENHGLRIDDPWILGSGLSEDSKG